MTPLTALVFHPACNRHHTGRGHPENQERLPALLAAVRQDAELGAALLERMAAPATEEDLLRVHSREHLAAIRRAVDEARGTGLAALDPDTPVGPASWEAALAAAGCAITAGEMVLDGPIPTAFALCRPPGHHAAANASMGFCLANNVAVAIRRLQALGRIERALVVDWDVHHGNGTQDVFYEDPTVFVLSLHLSPHYPGTGAAVERGAGAGEGFTLNVPLAHGAGASEYRRRFRAALDRALESFEPDLVFVSAGFDCLAGDPLGGLLLEPPDLHAITVELMARTRAATGGRMVAVLEGGYVPDRSGQGLVNVLRAFAGLPPREEPRGAA